MFNAGVIWTTVRLTSRKADQLSAEIDTKADHLAASIDALSHTVAKLDASMQARHEENLRRFERLESSIE